MPQNITRATPYGGASKDYVDQHGGGGSGVTEERVHEIVAEDTENLVTETELEEAVSLVPANLSTMKFNPPLHEVNASNRSDYLAATSQMGIRYYQLPLDNECYKVDAIGIAEADEADGAPAPVLCAQYISSEIESALTGRGIRYTGHPLEADSGVKLGLYLPQNLSGKLDIYVCNGFVYHVDAGK